MLSFTHILLGICLIVLSIEDIRKGLIKDKWLFMIGILALLHCGGIHWASFFILGGIGMGLYFGYLWSIGKEGMGWGDVKMMAVSGLWISCSEIPLFLLLAGGLGILIALVTRLGYKRAEFPFGPALALALWICVFGNPMDSIGEKNDLFFFGSFVGPSHWGST